MTITAQNKERRGAGGETVAEQCHIVVERWYVAQCWGRNRDKVNVHDGWSCKYTFCKIGAGADVKQESPESLDTWGEVYLG